MKYGGVLIGMILQLLLATTINAQCDFDDKAPIAVGQTLVGHAYCPSGGSVTLLNVMGGGGQYVYEIIDGPVIRMVQSQNFFNALPAGAYRARISSCNGSLKDITFTVSNYYASMNSWYWQSALQKQSGFTCGITNNGVYKLSKPSYTGGTAPFKIQLSTTANFTTVPFEPGNDSALFSGLSANTTYYIRITDACNNFITFNFVTPVATPSVPLSVPTLAFSRAYFYGDCTGRETVYLYFRDSATWSNYDPANAYTNKVFWGNQSLPYMRVKIEDAVSGLLYADRHVSLTKSGSTYYLYYDNTINGETGLAAPGTGKLFYSISPGANSMPYLYASSTFPANAPLKVTLYFPGGDHCGTTVPAYSKIFYYNLGTHGMPQPLITGITSNCNTSGTFFKVDFNINYAGDTISLVKLSPSYTVLTKNSFGSYSNYYTTISYSPLVPGDTYRVIIKDSCGRMDSMNVVYNPSSSILPPPAITDSVQTNFRCPANPADTVYTILLRPLPAGYSILNVTINGIGAVSNTAIANWNNSTLTGYKLNKLLPPGTYTYNVTWINLCQTGTVTKSITISPLGDPPAYARDLTLSISTLVAACNADGYKAININGFIKNVNTNYTFNNLRLVSTPNNYVFPLDDLVGFKINFAGSGIYLYKQIAGDSVKIAQGYSGLKIRTGQEGNYTIAIDVRCPDGTLVETLTRTITVASAPPAVSYIPNLKYANALICDGGGSELKLNMLPVGGIRPFTYEYKRDTSTTYSLSGSGGTDSLVTISPAPPAGTVYDIRVTDACGMTATNKVTVASFTGNFFIYQYPVDCTNNPFELRAGTSFINGAYYTWKRNGTIIAEGYNAAFVTLLGVTVDSITVDINIYNCYARSVSRTLVSPNPCNIIVLPVNALKLAGTRMSEASVQLNWKTQSEQNMSHYEVEKCTDGVQYKFVGRANAFNLNWEHSYIFNDTEASPLIFYRLKIVDKNARVKYSEVIKIENKKYVKPVLQVSPNPAHDNITIKVAAEKTTTYKAKIYNDKGQLIKDVLLSPEEATGGKLIDISILAAGSYFISMIDNWEIVATGKFIKQ